MKEYWVGLSGSQKTCDPNFRMDNCTAQRKAYVLSKVIFDNKAPDRTPVFACVAPAWINHFEIDELHALDKINVKFWKFCFYCFYLFLTFAALCIFEVLFPFKSPFVNKPISPATHCCNVLSIRALKYKCATQVQLVIYYRNGVQETKSNIV